MVAGVTLFRLRRMTITVGDNGNAKGIQRLRSIIWRPSKPKVDRDFPAFLDGLARSVGAIELISCVISSQWISALFHEITVDGAKRSTRATRLH